MTGTVTVACKVANGLLLRLFKMVEDAEPVLGGGTRKIKRAEQIGEAVKINGPGAALFGRNPAYPVVAGYALTPNVDAEFFTEWLKQNKDHDAVKANLIFAYDKPADVEACAKEHEAQRSGLEPIDPEKPQKALKGIERGTKEAA
jgi:hypothetical protein